MNPQAPVVQYPQCYCIQDQAVPLLENGAAVAGSPSPLVPPSLRHLYNVTPSPPPQQQLRYHLEMVAGQAPQPAKFRGDMKTWKDGFFRWLIISLSNRSATSNNVSPPLVCIQKEKHWNRRKLIGTGILLAKRSKRPSGNTMAITTSQKVL